MLQSLRRAKSCYSAMRLFPRSHLYGTVISDAQAEGMLERIRENNDLGGIELKDLITFRVAGKDLGYLAEDFARVCANYKEVFEYQEGDRVLQLIPTLDTLESRTEAVQRVNVELRDKGMISGWRSEFLPVVDAFSSEPSLLIERASYGWYGLKGYGVHVNGYVRNSETGDIESLWVAKRAKDKSTWPGMLDHIVAGGQPFGITPTDNVIKECGEEAGIPEDLARKATSTGAVSYLGLDELGKLKRDSLFCFDLELPEDFSPLAVDGEVEGFHLHSIEEVLNIIAKGLYKPNVNLVVIDFLMRQGLIAPESPRYLEIVSGLRESSTCK